MLYRWARCFRAGIAAGLWARRHHRPQRRLQIRTLTGGFLPRRRCLLRRLIIASSPPYQKKRRQAFEAQVRARKRVEERHARQEAKNARRSSGATREKYASAQDFEDDFM